jgi:hypothetical protein
VGQSLASKNMNMEDEEATALESIIKTTGEDTADREDLVHAVVNSRVCE